ncbi:hypothetical protein G9A89_021156 [Geosiphon pyriformis]|nr:hypothetical protein G9A89_021156 [Geosiphon pyriformis]
MPREEIKFYRQKNIYGEFSNFYPAPINLDGQEWPTTEHYFQAQKFNSNPEIVEYIRNIGSPGAAAKEGRRRDLPLRKDWERVKEDVMMRALFAKFTQHTRLKQMLLDTGDAKLIEHTTNDTYWGDGGGEDRGRNRLGVLLMNLRIKLRDQQNDLIDSENSK